MREWLDIVEILIPLVADIAAGPMTVVTRTITGLLKKEVKRFLSTQPHRLATAQRALFVQCTYIVRTLYVHCTYSLGSHSWTYNVRTVRFCMYGLGSHPVPKRNIRITYGLGSDRFSPNYQKSMCVWFWFFT